MQPEPSDQFVQSLARGLEVLKTLSEVELAPGAASGGRGGQTLSDVARSTGLTRATARRFLLTLTELGYLRTDGKYFALTPKVLELGFGYLSGLGLPEVAQPHLERLSHELGESTSASVLDGADIVYVARVPTRRIMTVGITIGTRFAAHATAMGRVMLAGLPSVALASYLTGLRPTVYTPSTITDPVALRAELERVREQGWSLVDGELEVGLRSVAAPLSRGGAVVGAINVSTSSASYPLEQVLTEFVPRLRETARHIDADLQRVALNP